MIFNWREAIEEIIKNKECFMRDNFDRKHILCQNSLIIEYLKEQGKNKDEIFEIWKTIKTDFNTVVADEEYTQILFDEIWRTSSRYKQMLNAKYYTIIIYQEEINYLNGLECPLWFKKYLLILLCLYKFYGGREIKYGNSIRHWIRTQCAENITIDKYDLMVRKYRAKYNLFSVKVRTGQYRKYFSAMLWVNFCKNNGKIVARLKSPDEYFSIVHLLDPFKEVCEVCGKAYVPSMKAKRHNLCDDCYEIKRKADKAAYIRKIRQKTDKNTM